MRAFRDMPLVSISDAQRQPLPWANWGGPCSTASAETCFGFGEGEAGYLAFLGRICPEKPSDRAIEIARRAGLPLQIAAKVDPLITHISSSVIAPLLDDPLVDFIGEISDDRQERFLGDARRCCFRSIGRSRSGWCMIEAMACGTPVIAFGAARSRKSSMTA